MWFHCHLYLRYLQMSPVFIPKLFGTFLDLTLYSDTSNEEACFQQNREVLLLTTSGSDLSTPRCRALCWPRQNALHKPLCSLIFCRVLWLRLHLYLRHSQMYPEFISLGYNTSWKDCYQGYSEIYPARIKPSFQGATSVFQGIALCSWPRQNTVGEPLYPLVLCRVMWLRLYLYLRRSQMNSNFISKLFSVLSSTLLAVMQNTTQKDCCQYKSEAYPSLPAKWYMYVLPALFHEQTSLLCAEFTKIFLTMFTYAQNVMFVYSS